MKIPAPDSKSSGTAFHRDSITRSESPPRFHPSQNARVHTRFARPGGMRHFRGMSTITAILEPDADGSLHLPLPAEMRRGKIKVVASLTAVSGDAEPIPPARGALPKVVGAPRVSS